MSYTIPGLEDEEELTPSTDHLLRLTATPAPKRTTIKGLITEVLERTRLDVLAVAHPPVLPEPKPGAFIMWVYPALIQDPKRVEAIQRAEEDQNGAAQEDAFVDYLSRVVAAWSFEDPINEESLRELGPVLMGLMVKAIFRKEEDVKESGSNSSNG